MKKTLCKSAMFYEAEKDGRGHKLIVEILIFLAVFAVASAAESLILFGPLAYWMFTDGGLLAAIQSGAGALAENMDIPAYLQNVMKTAENMMNSMPEWLLVLQLFATVSSTVIVILFCRVIQKRKLPSVGFRNEKPLREYLVGAAVGAGMITASVLISFACGGTVFAKGSISVGLWLLYLVGFVLQGASEEILCRGYLMVSVARKNPLWAAVITNSLIFAALHLMNPGISLLAFVNLFISGCVFSVYVIKRGNLWGACALHSFWNFFQGNVFGVSVSGMSKMTSPILSTSVEGFGLINGGSFGLEGGLAVTITELAVLAILLFLVPCKKEAAE